MKKSKYTIRYFIKLFSKIPRKQWTTGMIELPYNRDCCCVLGHVRRLCGGANCDAEISLIGLIPHIVGVNDGWQGKQKTPKGRVLAALRGLLKK